MNEIKPILLVGIPRSGSTWATQVLSRAEGCTNVQEPDNEKENPLAYILKKNLHRFPYLRENMESPDYYCLWNIVFSDKKIPYQILHIFEKYFMPDQWILEFMVGGKCGYIHEPGFFRFVKESHVLKGNKIIWGLKQKKYAINRIAKYFYIKQSTNRIIVKSVHASLSIPWIEKYFKPQIVVMLRNPLNIIASYLSLRMAESIRNIFIQKELIQDHLTEFMDIVYSAKNRVQQIAVQIGAIYKVLENQIAQHPEWIVIKHETLCEDPLEEFKQLYHELDLNWTTETENFIKASNKEGKGFSRNRVAKNEIDKWKRKLTSEQIKDINRCIASFNLNLY